MQRNYVILGAIAAIGIGAAAYFGGAFAPNDAVGQTGSGATAVNASTAPNGSTISAAPLQEVTVSPEGRVLGDVIIGDPEAPVTVIEYASLTCPHCATFHNATYPTVKADYIDQGLVRMIVREVYFDYEGVLAAAIARCGGEDRYSRFLDVIFKQQSQWHDRGNRQATIANLRRIGIFGGLTPERVDACLTDETFHRALTSAYEETATADGVRSTPYFLVNGDPVRGAVGASEMAAAIDAHLPN